MKNILLLAIAGFMYASCTPTKMALTGELDQQHDELSVKGRQGILINQKLSFGGFSTSKVKRSWTRGSSERSGISYYDENYRQVNLISKEYIDRKQTINFSLSDGSRQSEVFCVSRFNAENLTVGKNENSLLNIALDIAGLSGHSSNLYYVQVYINDNQPWQLVLDNQAAQGKAKSYTGVFAFSRDRYYEIRPVTKLNQKGRVRNMPFGSVGYEIFTKEGAPVAAVSLMDNGMVFLGKTSAEERFLLANLCAALLLQENIGE